MLTTLQISCWVVDSRFDIVFVITAVARTLIGGGGVYSYIHVLSDEFLLKSNSNLSIWKETSRAEHEYMNKHPPPPINVLATALFVIVWYWGAFDRRGKLNDEYI